MDRRRRNRPIAAARRKLRTAHIFGKL